ncbi:MAG: hypothetical protein ACERK6_07265, partial [Candidatus Aminicenantaceae bacterium]
KTALASLELLNLMYLYYLFIFAILISDLIFMLSLFKIVKIKIAGPYVELWGLAILMFILEVLIVLVYEKEDSVRGVLLVILAYLTYTKLWVVVVLLSMYQDIIIKRDVVWDKTERFDISSNIKVDLIKRD